MILEETLYSSCSKLAMGKMKAMSKFSYQVSADDVLMLDSNMLALGNFFELGEGNYFAGHLVHIPLSLGRLISAMAPIREDLPAD